MKNITTIFFDLGDTFRVIRKDADYEYAAKKRIVDLLGADADPIEFYRDVIEPRYNLYREWALSFYCEAPEKQLWTRWLAYDYPRDRVEVGSKTYLESTKELRMIAQEMRNALTRLKLDPPEEGGGTGGQFLPL